MCTLTKSRLVDIYNVYINIQWYSHLMLLMSFRPKYSEFHLVLSVLLCSFWKKIYAQLLCVFKLQKVISNSLSELCGPLGIHVHLWEYVYDIALLIGKLRSMAKVTAYQVHLEYIIKWMYKVMQIRRYAILRVFDNS